MPRLLFVCVENANRSQMAEGFARFHGGYQVEALSAGSRPAGQVSPRAVEAMAELGIDISQQFPKSVDDITGEFDAVVTMGCGDACPYIPGKRYLDWELNDPAGKNLAETRTIRDEIASRIERLLPELDDTEATDGGRWRRGRGCSGGQSPQGRHADGRLCAAHSAELPTGIESGRPGQGRPG